MKIGTIIRKTYNVRNFPERDGYKYANTYFRLVDGPFVIELDDYNMKFQGLHFVCLGDDYFHGMKGEIRGLELLDSDFEIVEEIPGNLL